ncbi:response regulator [uncultured Robinsoniella sp.]|uniref:response regulator transcription factor n=1 Tax=uncultured Robinsoniella sp. TaxID=904190 RepID=UPI00374E594A
MINIVIVEDEMLVRLGMKMCLDEYSAELKVAAAFGSGEDAEHYFRQNTADVLITDIRLTGETGLDLIRHLKSQMTHMAVIVLSCYEDFSYARSAMELGVDKYILKHELSEDELPKLVCEIYQKKLKKGMISTGRNDNPAFFEDGEGDQCYRIAYINLRGTGERTTISEENTDYDFIVEILQEILNINHMGECFLRHGKEVFCILRFEPEETTEQVNKKVLDFYQNARKNMKNYFNKNLYLSITETFDSLSQVNHYYKEAKEGCSLSFYYEMSRLIDLQAAIPLKQIIPAPVFEKEEAFSEHWMEQASIQMERFLKAEKEANRPPEEVKLQAVRFIHEMEDYLSKYYQTELHKLFPGEEVPNYIWVNGFDSGQELLLWLSDIRKRVQSYLMDKESIAEKMELYLEENYAKELSLKEVAEHFHMSTAYFCQYFKKHTGDTFVHYLNYLRIEKAKPMLLKGEESVEEVAEKVGITNSNYFFRVFKQITGKTVGEFRKGGFMESDLNFVNKS